MITSLNPVKTYELNSKITENCRDIPDVNADEIADFDVMLAGVSIYTMNKLTSDGNVTMEVIEKICTAFGCKVDDILEFIKE